MTRRIGAVAPDPFDFFSRLGRLADQRWSARDYDERAFPELAVELLRGEMPTCEITPHDLLAWVLRTDTMPQQLDPRSRFGQPPLTLYRSSRLIIDALFWMDGTTAIHQHGFAGAFHVLAGSSVHSEYGFELEERVN